MVTIDGKWRMEGLDREDPGRIKTSAELSEVIERFGFLPLFKNNIAGFSVEEMTAADCWWAGRPEEDPWEWREVIANEGRIAYGKLFCNRAGFISREWYPYFAAYRRDGYDFDSRYEDGLASRKHKKIVELLEITGSMPFYESQEGTGCAGKGMPFYGSQVETGNAGKGMPFYETQEETSRAGKGMPSYELKKAAGFGKEGESGFEGAVTALQMQTYIVVSGFHRRRNRKNEEYGWSVADYALSEALFGAEHVRSAYGIGTIEAKNRIIAQLKKLFPIASDQEAEKLIK